MFIAQTVKVATERLLGLRCSTRAQPPYAKTASSRLLRKLPQGGALLAVTELGGDPSDTSVVHFAFQPREGVDPADKLAHLEVIRQVAAGQAGLAVQGRQAAREPVQAACGLLGRRDSSCFLRCTCPSVKPGRPPSPALCSAALRPQGKWLGLRCAAAGDRFLQARKRSTPSRLVFFSQNVGTWEQWELGSAGPDPDAADWACLPATLRHRRLPQFELAVELVRVGAVALPPNAAATPRSLPVGAAGEPGAGGAAAGRGPNEDPGMERRELQRMSGVLVHVSWGTAGWAAGVGGPAGLAMHGLHLACPRPPVPWLAWLPGCVLPLSTCSSPLCLPACLRAAGVAALCGPGEGGAHGHRGARRAAGGGRGGAARLGRHAGGGAVPQPEGLL